MNFSGVAKAAIGVAVCVIMLTVVVTPILGEFTEHSDGETGTNEGETGYTLFRIEPGTTITYNSIDAKTVVNIGGTPIDYSSQYLAIMSESLVIGCDHGLFPNISIDHYINLSTVFSLTYDGSTVTGTLGDTPETIAVGDMYLMFSGSLSANSNLSESGYVYVSEAGLPVHVNADDLLFVFFNTNSGFFFEGTYDSMEFYGDGTFIDNTVTFTAGATDGEAIELTAIEVSNKYVEAVIFVPETYVITPPVEAQVSGPMASIIDLVPLIIAVGLIIATVAVTYVSVKSGNRQRPKPFGPVPRGPGPVHEKVWAT